jgi:predicted SnoaL-like aldol condensation-catalyzing enzyme
MSIQYNLNAKHIDAFKIDNEEAREHWDVSSTMESK